MINITSFEAEIILIKNDLLDQIKNNLKCLKINIMYIYKYFELGELDYYYEISVHNSKYMSS